MKLELRAKSVRMTEKLREHIEQCMRTALNRFENRVLRVRVDLSDLNGPKGGEDTQCRVLAYLSPGGEIVIRDTRNDPFAAVASASDRVRTRVSRHFRRLSDRQRGRR